MSARVEILSSDDEDDKVPVQPAKPTPTAAAPTALHTPTKPVGPPKPPAGTALKRRGKKAPVVAAAPKPAPAVVAAPASAPAPAPTPSTMPPLEEPVSSSSSDEDDLPPPLEPLPGVHAKQRAKAKAAVKAIAGAPLKEQAAPSDQESPAPAAEPSIGPAKPANSGQSKKHSAAAGPSGRPNYLERDLQEFPLFMDSLPKERSDNPDIAALQSLADEETKEERAEHFKESGNECMTRTGLKYWDSAIEFYTRAIQCGSSNLDNVSVYFSNRAAVQMLKKNWGHASRDSLMALELNPDNVKAMYRASKCFYELRKLPEALKYLRMAMAKGKTKQLVELERDIARRMRKESLKEEKKAKEAQETLEKETDLARTMRERGYRIGTDDVYEMLPRLQEMDLKPLQLEMQGNEAEISMPVLLLYPQSRQSDFVARWSEKLFVRDLLEMVFREGTSQAQRNTWDSQGLYTAKEVGNMCVFAKTNDKFNTFDKQEFVRIKLSNTLGEALLCHPNYIAPIVPVFFVMHISWKPTFFEKEMQAEWGVPARRRE